jgi:hypothetical protein
VRTCWRLFSVVLLFVVPWPPCSSAQQRVVPDPVQFAPPVAYSFPGSYPQVIASGEFTNDGIQDLIVGAYYGDIGLKSGRGDGTFRRWINANSPSGSASALAVGKFDGKNLDIVVNDYDDAWVLLGDGKRGFPNYTWLDAGDNFVAGFAVGDFAGDGKQDIAALVDIPGQSSDSSVVYLYLGNGDGTFQPPRQISVSPLGPVAILTGDFNGDGIPDLVVPGDHCPIDGHHANCISVLLGNGNGTFQPPANFRGAAAQLTVADFNGDGKPDVAGVFPSGVSVWLNTTPFPASESKRARLQRH